MTTNSRDDFTDKVRRTIAERAAYICSNPICRRPTIGPHSEPDKSLKTGIACHVHAAAAGGPRFDENQTPEQRRSIENAIWLCAICSGIVDKDSPAYSAARLREWKLQHETWIRNGGIIPKLPEISLVTLAGRTVPDTVGTVAFHDEWDSKEHHFKLKNASDVEISMVDARIQIPEPIIGIVGASKPPGINAAWAPDRAQLVAVVTGGGSVTRTRPPMPTNIYRLQIDRVPPNQQLEISFLTSIKPFKDHDLDLNGPPNREMDPMELSNFILGKFHFQYHGATVSRQFFAPINEMDRNLAISEVTEDLGDWKPRIVTLFF